MSDQVTFAHVLQFTTNTKHLLQQEGSKLRGSVSTGSHTGNGAVPVEQIGSVAAVPRTDRHSDTPILDTPHARRWVFPSDFEWGDMVDKQDIVRMLIDPKSPYTQAGVMALGRQIDDTVIAAATGTATVGTVAGGAATTTEAFDTTNFGVEIGGGTGLTLAKITETWRRFANANLDMDREQMFFVISPHQVEDLWQISGTVQSYYASKDFMNEQTLPNARVIPFLGFNFIVSTRLSSPAAGVTRCFAYAKSGLYLGLWNDIEVRADERADKGFNWQVYARMTIGATRLEQGRVIAVDCTN
jgi:hypothetical protein